MNPIERVQKLIALATNDGAPIDEQRNAALAAVRLLVEHKLLDERAVPPAPPIGGFAGIGALFAGVTADMLFQQIGVIAQGAGAMEILELRNRNLVLERKSAAQAREIERLNTELVGKTEIRVGVGGRRRRRR